MKNNRRPTRAQGFTLVEMLIVLLLIGIAAAIIAANASGNTDGARAKLLQRIAQASAQNINQLALTCGTTTAVGSIPVPASGKTIADVLYGGSTNVGANYQACYQQSSVRPLRDAVVKNGTVWQAESYPITLGGGGTGKITVQFAGVPDKVVLELVRRFQDGVTALATSDTTSDVVQYTASSAGTRNVTLLLD